MAETVDPILYKKEKTIDSESNTTKQYIAAVCASMGALAAGSTLAWTSPAYQTLANVFSLEGSQIAWIGSFLAIGALLSALPSGICAEKLGRKLTMLFSALPLLGCWVTLVFASQFWAFLLARFLAGVGTATICVAVPMYISEMADAKIRGTLGSFFALFLCAGIFLMFIVAKFASYNALNLILGTLPLVFFFMMLGCPETPVFLVQSGNFKKAEAALRFLRGDECDVRKELMEIERAVEERTRTSGGLSLAWSTKGNRRAVISCIGLFAFQQLTGINYIMFYSDLIFERAGSTMDPTVSSIIIALVQVVVSGVAVFIIERYDRKSFLLFSSVVSMICLCVLGVAFHLQAHQVSFPGLGAVPLICLVLFITAFSIGFGPVPWMMLGELLVPDLVSVVSSICVLTFWSLVFFVTKVFPSIAVMFGGHVAFYIFSGLMAACVVFIGLVVPETRGKTREQIQDKLNA